uniref:Uncharacterized protein n=1 Tax=viral metagenome TaxID=1070528 RepID=A0A6M3IQ48_9ZZZZ
MERTKRELTNAEVKLRRAKEHGKHDPVSGFTLKQIAQWLSETELGQVILRRN